MYYILSYFNQINGPELLYSTQPSATELIKKQILNLMDAHLDEGFFEYVYTQDEMDITTGNYLFEIPSEWSRGKIELLLITIVLDPIQNPRNFLSLMQNFVDKAKASQYLFKGLYLNSHRSEPEILENHIRLENMVLSLLNQSETLLKKVTLGQIFILGLMAVGKTSIVNQINRKVFDPNSHPTLGIQLAKIVFENYTFNAIDVGGQVNLRDLWQKMPCEPSGLIYVTDCNASEQEKLKSKKFLDEIMGHIQQKCRDNPDFPFLLVANKTDLNPRYTQEDLRSYYHPEQLKHKYNLALTSAKMGTGIQRLFRTIVKKLIEQAPY